MPAGEYDGLLRRITELEAQLRTLRQVLDISSGSVTLRTGGSFAFQVGGSLQITVGGSTALTTGAHLSLKAASSIAIGAGSSLAIASAQAATVTAMSLTGSFAADVDLSSSRHFYVTAGKDIEIEAATLVKIENGEAELMLKRDGSVLLDGKDIDIKASGRFDAKASGDVTIKGSKIHQN